jgi:hypothetical protein
MVPENKTEDTNKLTLLAFKIIGHPLQHTVGNVPKASVNCQQRPYGGGNPITCDSCSVIDS